MWNAGHPPQNVGRGGSEITLQERGKAKGGESWKSYFSWSKLPTAADGTKVKYGQTDRKRVKMHKKKPEKPHNTAKFFSLPTAKKNM